MLPTYLSLKCTDLTAARRFYEGLGFAFVEEEHPGVPPHLAADDGGFVLELHGPHGAGEPVGAGCRIGFAVTDLDATVATLVAAGGRLQRRSPVWAVMIDPDGRRVELTGAG